MYISPQDCLSFPAPEGKIPSVIVRHHGTDGWKPVWFRIYFDDGTLVQCNDNQDIDGGGIHTIDCL